MNIDGGPPEISNEKGRGLLNNVHKLKLQCWMIF